MTSNYRKLHPHEIDTMTANGCSALDWDNIQVDLEFQAGQVRDCRFFGEVCIGKNVTIDGVRGGMANYVIGDGATIVGAESLITASENFSGASLFERKPVTFGCGTPVNVLNESGGRTVLIHDRLSAQEAYLSALWRHRPALTDALNGYALKRASEVASLMGTVGENAKILHCGQLKNVNIGVRATLQGVAELSDGTVNSSPEAPTFVGRGVIARRFIIDTGSEVTDGAMLESCFIGQGCLVGKGFSAEHSLFFANCECFCGEACAAFAGPHTVTHHKSSLLVGGQFSFYNAGSGTNMSNHMYRLGPVHQGIMERGCKTASSSYVLFPARIGAFTVAKGRHYGHPDTGDFPFSYLIETNEGSLLLPAANLATAGTVRDTEKWAARDRRTGEKRDLLRPTPWTPYLIEKIRRAAILLESFEGRGAQVAGRGVKIKTGDISKMLNVYKNAVNRYIGDVLVSRISSQKSPTAPALPVNGPWIDVAGLVAPLQEIEALAVQVENGIITSSGGLQKKLSALHENFSEWEWTYVRRLIAGDSAQIDTVQLAEAIDLWAYAVSFLNELTLTDARKEFSGATLIPFGADGDEFIRNLDFQAVRGDFEKHPLVEKLNRETEAAQQTAHELIARLKGVL